MEAEAAVNSKQVNEWQEALLISWATFAGLECVAVEARVDLAASRRLTTPRRPHRSLGWASVQECHQRRLRGIGDPHCGTFVDEPCRQSLSAVEAFARL
jgi:hypothetical protein